MSDINIPFNLKLNIFSYIFFFSLDISLDLLLCLNAIKDNEQLTPLGLHLAQLPIDPQTGKMVLLGAIFGCLDPILSVAASLSFKDAFQIPLGQEEEVDEKKRELSCNSNSDHVVMINAIQWWEEAKQRGDARRFCSDNFLSVNILNNLASHKEQLAKHLKDKNFIASPSPKGTYIQFDSFMSK